ncbi:alpha/beta fold hydrolase [Olivibacter sp. XZL3]|uniref:alpha/beta fold hydrolase n=1 Tax=Olivibacter sp. XZL3 TaxID=1735116 RepID=UPI0010665E87|nr:alpha/beta hydrolase [Olivibacter sp. XZL3]
MYNNFPLQRKKIRVGDISISYLLKDEVRPHKTVIFIHGFPFSKNMWHYQLEALPNGIRGIAVDVRGHGGSTSGHGYFSIDVFARDLIAFIEKLGLTKVVLCGISMGGYIALRALQIAPSRFYGMVLADTNAEADSNEAKIKRFDTIQSVLKYGRRTFAIGFVKNVFSASSLLSRPEEVELIRSSIRRNDVRSICATLLALASRTDTTDSLTSISFPCLIIRGSEDKLMTREQANALKEQIKFADLEEIDQCGHLPNLEAPEKFNQALIQYLAKLA